MGIKENIKAGAKSLGFPLIGISLPSQPEHFPVFEKWLADGKHASMDYLGRDYAVERRADPKSILPETKSILSFAIPYQPHKSQLPAAKHETGRVASYAWGDDYHEVLIPRLEQLVKWLEDWTGKPVLYKSYTDTGAILERDFAQASGIGWIGKNTCLISPELGSYLFLSEIFLDTELEPDQKFEADRCGSCHRCIDACPTGCILPDRTIDAGKCISYQTIENRGAIPLELRDQIGDWIFGCDVCQMVCPWNVKFAAEKVDPSFQYKTEIVQPDLKAEVYLTPAEFKKKFKNSPIRRTKRKGYFRNIAVVMGNLQNEDFTPELNHLLGHETETVIRSHAAWALGKIGTSQAKASLEEFLKIETDQEVITEIKQALQNTD